MAFGAGGGRYTPDGLGITVQDLERSLWSNPKNTEALALYGHVLLHEGHLRLARAVFSEATRHDPSPWLDTFEGEYLVEQGKDAKAEALLQKALDTTSDRQIRIEAERDLAEFYRLQHRNDAARMAFNALIDLDPRRMTSVDLYARYLLFDLRDYENASVVAARLVDGAGRARERWLYGDALVAQGANLLSDANRFDEGAELMRRGVRELQTPERALQRAVQHPATSVSSQVLLTAGQSINITDEQGDPLLFLAVKSDDPQLIGRWISQGADVDATNSEGVSALQLAVSLRLDASARTLLAAGASPAPNLREMAVAGAMVSLAELIGDTYDQKYPNWSTFIAGIGSAQPVHLRRALALARETEVWNQIESAMTTYPQTVIAVADAEKRLQVPCGPAPLADAAAKRRSVEQRLEAVTDARELQLRLAIVPADPAIGRCIQLLKAALAD